MRTINKLTKLVLSFLLVITCINFSIVQAEDGSDENYSEPTAVETISEEPASEPEQEVIPEEPAATEEIIVKEPVAEEPVVEEAAPVEEEKQEEVAPEVIEEAKVEEENNTPEIEAEPATQEETVEPEVQQEAPVEPEVQKVETVEEVKVTVVMSYVDESDHPLTDPITGSYPTEYRLDENVDAFKSFDGYAFEKVIVNDDAKNTISKDDVQKNGFRITKDMTSLKLVYQKMNLESESKEVIPEVTEEAVEEAEPESNTNETELSAFDQTAFAGKVGVHASAAEGVLPKGARLIVEQVNRKAILNAVENTVSDNNKEMDSAVALDISIVDKDGNKIQPNGIVNITFVNTGVSGDEVKIYHVEDDASAVTEIANNTDSFDASHFSIYVIAGEKEVPLATYTFIANGSVVSTQIVKTGDSLITPTAPEMNGKAFVGWYLGDTEFEDFNKRLTVTKTEPIEINARYEDALYVYFYNPDGSKIMRTQKVADHKVHDYSSVTYDVDATHKLVGWTAEANGTVNIAKNIAVPEDKISTSVYAIIEEGYWVTFDSDGGSNIDSQFVFDTISLNGITPTKPGYTFAGWYNGSEKVENGAKVTAPMTLKAYWKASEVNYTINYWQQKVTDDKDATDAQKTYEYVEAETKKATTGTKISATNSKTYKGFKYNANNSSKNVEISGDGTTIINVYYDRVLCTVNFYAYESTGWFGGGSWNIIKTVTGLYGANLPEGAWDTSTYKWYISKDRSTGCVLLTSFDFETAGYAGNEGNKKTNGVVTTCNFYGNRSSSDGSINYYNEQADGTFKLVQTIRSSGGTLTVHEKYDGYELYKYSTGSNASETSEYWSRQKTVKDGNKINAKTINIASKLKTYSLSYYNYNTVALTKRDIKYTASLKTYGSFIPDRPSELPDYYHFDGWYKDKAGTTKFDFDTEKMPNANLQIYAKWSASNIQFIYNLNQPESSNTPTPIDVEAGTIANTVLPAIPEVNDYTFAGWYVADGNGNLTTEVFHAEDAIVRNTSVIGKWLYNGNLTVTYSPGAETGATVPTDDNVYAGGARVTVGANATTTSKKKFLGWQLNGNLYQPGASFEINKDLASKENVVTLTAAWGSEEASTTLTYNPGNGSGTAKEVAVLNNVEVTIETHGTLGFLAPEVAGKEYYFAGWATSLKDAEDGNAAYSDGQTIRVDVNGTNVLYATWVEKTVITLVANSSVGNKYDGTKKEVNDFQPLTNSEYTVEGLTAHAEGTDAGVYETEITGTPIVKLGDNVVTDRVVVKTQKGQLTISKRDVTLTSESDEKVYDRTPLTNHSVTPSVDGFAKDEGATYDFTGSQTDVGESDNSFTYTLNRNTNPDNYNINVVSGKLKVTPFTDEVTVTIIGNTDTKTYDGNKHSVEGYTVSVPKPTLYQENDITFTGSAKAEGTDAATYPMRLKAEDFTNKNTNFAKVTFIVEDGKLVINKRQVTLTSASASKKYDGTPLTKPDVTVTDEGNIFVGEVSDIHATGSVTNVSEGEVKNAITFTKGDSFKDKNYEITKNEGKLSIIPITDEVTVTIKGNTATATYDGNSHSVSGYEVDSISNPLYVQENIGFTGVAKAEGTKVGTYPMNLSAQQFSNTNTNFTNVTFTVTDGYLTINPKSIVPDKPDTPEDKKTGISVTKPEDSKYNGEEQKNKPTVEDTKTGATLVENVDYELSYTAAVNAGTVEVTITGIGNYTGTANTSYQITKRNVTLTSASDSKIYDKKPLTKNEVTVSGDGFVKEEGATYNVTGSQTEVGSSKNKFTYALKSNTKASNYNITKVEGDLIVTSQDGEVVVTITLACGTSV